jgi:hypothetical protein
LVRILFGLAQLSKVLKLGDASQFGQRGNGKKVLEKCIVIMRCEMHLSYSIKLFNNESKGFVWLIPFRSGCAGLDGVSELF